MSIPGWFDFQDFYEEMVLRVRGEPAIFVECGTYLGASAAHMAALITDHMKPIRFETWDDWSGVRGEAPGELEAAARRNLASPSVTMRTGDCLRDAPLAYEDGSLALVFLDDDHSRAHVLAEMRAWWPKIRPGGILAGHDIGERGVLEAITEWSRETGIRVEPVSRNCWRAIKPHGR